MALTYRWPRDFPTEAKSTQDTIHDRMRGLNTSKLPPSFNDVFQVAAKIGISYVWIDSLCILQDGDKEDWNHEAARMSQVYQNACVTLAIAVPPTEPHLGLFRRGDPSGVLSERFFCPLEDGPDQEVVVMKAQQEAYGSSPLVPRGWCFQEREISQRLIHYTETQVLWECRTVRASEGLPNGAPTQKKWPVGRGLGAWPGRMLDIDLSNEAVNRAWHQAVEDYSARDLIEPTDKLPALAGLAAAVHGRYKEPTTSRYLAGLWQDDFRQSLAWRRADIPWWLVASSIAKRYTTYVAPTWSWASVTAPVSYVNVYEPTHWFKSHPKHVSEFRSGKRPRGYGEHDRIFGQRDSDAKYVLRVLDVSVQTSTTDPFGAISEAGAVLRCIAGLMPVEIPCPLDASKAEISHLPSKHLPAGEENAHIWFDVPFERSDLEGREDLFYIPLGLRSCCDPGLVVEPTGLKENEFRRVGLFSRIERECYGAAQVKEITIV